MEKLPNKVLENAIRIHNATIKAFENFKDADYCSSLDKVIVQLLEELKEYRSLEEQGLLVKLPCKVGDTVYSICYMEIEEIIVGSIGYSAEGFLVWGVEDTFEGILCDSVFLTKEEAEQALKRLESES